MKDILGISLGAIVMFAPLIYVLYLLDILYGAAITMFILSALSLLVGLQWMYSCKGKHGCMSGVIFILPVITLPFGLLFLLADYLLK